MTISKYGLTPQLSAIAKKVAWVNIFIQFAFPISATIPSNVFAKENIQENQSINKPINRDHYQVQKDDTPESIAKKFNIKLSKLIEDNPDYVSLVGKLKIKEGIILNIPKTVSHHGKWLNANEKDLPEISTDGEELAQLVVNNASLLNKDTDGTQYAISQLTNKANAEIEQWLNQFGHARVSLSTDKNFTLESSSADLLVPLYDQEKNLVFSQTSYHRKDSRSQLNQGIGYRHFTDKFMMGFNAFYDYDLSRYHSRFGVGAEVWRDYFKLSANHYHRLSNWRTSDDVMDYNERPANGWDIRTEGYLPAYPQLGAKLIFEQYYGKEVGLFGKDNRQENPHAYTAGLNYTPVPLITFGAERRFGLNDNNENKFDLNIQYRLGESLSSQLNSDNVRAMRLMSGNRYDFVDRNNDIVLEYKKKTLVFLSLTSAINGYAKEEKDLGVHVNSKYPVKHIEWSANGLIANGGKINHNGAFNYSVILPKHISGSIQKNTYTISAVAIDEQGNRSDPVQSQIIVDQSAINTQKSLFDPSLSQLPADGHTQQQLILSVFDNDNKPVNINIDELKLNIKTDNSLSGSHISAFSKIGAGEYDVIVTAGSSPEKLILTPYFRDNTFNSADINFHADIKTVHIGKGDLSVIKDNAPADGVSENKIKVRVTDLNHNPVANYYIHYQADNGANIISVGPTGLDGEAEIPITNTHAGITNIKVTVGDIEYPISVNFTADRKTAYIPRALLTITPETSPADNTTEKAISLTVMDKEHNTVPNADVILRVNNQAQIKDNIVTTDKDGKASTTMVSKIAGDILLKAEVIESNQVTEATATFIGNISNGHIVSITPSAPPYIADGKTMVTFTAKVTDSFNNPLPNALIQWSTNRDSQIVNIKNISSTDKNGFTHTTLTSTQALDVTVTATTSNHSLSASPITFIANNQQGLITLSSDKMQIIADNKEQATLTALVKDKFNNPLPNVTVDWKIQGGHADKQQTKTDLQGQTVIPITATQAGLITAVATLKNGHNAQITIKTIADPNSATLSLSSNKTQAIADNNDTITVTAHVVDANKNPLIQQSVFWQSSPNQPNNGIVKTDDQGNAQVEVKGKVATAVTLTARLANNQSASLDLLFTPGQVDKAHSHFDLAPQTIIANGQSESLGTIELKDQFDNPVPKQEKSILLSGDNPTITFNSVIDKGNGIYHVEIKGKKEGISQITAKYDGINAFVLTQPLGFIADKQNATIQSVNVIAPFSVTANGQDSVTIQAKIVDKQGNPSMEGITVGWLTTLGSLSLPISKTDKNGLATITLSSQQAGIAQVTALLDSQGSLVADHDITFTTDVISADNSTLTLSPSIIVAGDGTYSRDNTLISVTLRDKQGNLLTGLKDKIKRQYSTALIFKEGAFSEISPGVYTAKISAQKAGTTTVSATVNSVTLKQTANLAVIADNASATVRDIVISNSTPKAGDTITYTAYIIDKYNNPINKDMPVTWTSDNVSTLSAALTFTDDKGVTKTQLTRGPAGLAKVDVYLKSGVYHAKDINFIADNVDENRSEITLLPANIIANGTDKAILSLIVKDKGGNLLPDQQIKGISNNPTITFGVAKQVSPAHYEIEVTGKKAGTASVSVNVNGTDFKKQKSLQLRADATTWQVKSASVDRTTMTAGDKGANYQATIVDANNNILPNVIVSWKLQGLADDYDFSTYTDAQGIARTKITSHVAGILKMSAYLDLNNHKAIQDVTVTPADIDANKSTFSSSRQSIGGDNKDSALLTVNLMDKYSNTIDGKTVSIKATSGQPNFSDNPLKSLGKGEYQTSLTSHIKDDITLTAEVNGITIASPLTIKVIVPKPDIIFSHQIQQEIYASAPINALTYTGVPNNINVMWSSADPTIATIDTLSGKISLKKAGTTTITLQTSGNDQYQPSQSSYPLVIDKAKPDMKLTSASTITSAWEDGVQHQITVAFNHPDAKNNINIHYISDDTDIVTVDNKGNIIAVKPGTTKINIQSEATDQFLADATQVSYQQDKGMLTYSFQKSIVYLSDSDTDNGPIQPPQVPQQPVPALAQATWSSSEPSKITITPEGMITALRAGNSKLELNVKNNVYYHDYSKGYDVSVAKTPKIKMKSFQFSSMKTMREEKSISAIEWHRLYTTDNHFSVQWEPDGDIPHAIDFVLRDSNDKELIRLQRHNYGMTPGSSGNINEPVIFDNIPEQALAINNKLKLDVEVFDDANKSMKKNYDINIVKISPNEVLSNTEITKKSIFFYTKNGSPTSYCQELPTGDTTHLFIQFNVRLKNKEPNDVMLYPVKVDVDLTNNTFDGRDNFKGTGALKDPLSYTQKVFDQSSGDSITFYETTSSLAVDRECKLNDSGSGDAYIKLTIDTNTASTKQSFQWSGASDTTK